MYAGLQHAVGEYVAIMDADLQDPPEMLPKMWKEFLRSLIKRVMMLSVQDE